MRTPRDALPGTRVAGAAAYALGERYRDLDRHLAGADIVHGAEIGTWFAAQAAGCAARMGFALALTVWETIAWRSTYRWPRERGYRKRVLPAAPTTSSPPPSAPATALLLEGVAPERITVSPAGHRPRPLRLRRRPRAAARQAPDPVGRAPRVGEGPSGRAARLRRPAPRAGRDRAPDVELLVVGDGPERKRLSATRASSASPTASSSAPRSPTTTCRRSTRRPPRWCSPACPRAAGRSSSAWSSSRRSPRGTPVIACSTGAIPEVLGGDGTLVAAGDWLGIAQALARRRRGRAGGARRGRPRAPGALLLGRRGRATARGLRRAARARRALAEAPRRARRDSRRARRPRTGGGARRGRTPGRGRRPG